MFRDRAEAGGKLAEALAKYRATDAVVLALPRGGVVPAYEIATALKLPLDIIATRKIGHPHSPEYAIGAVDEEGARILSEEGQALDRAWLESETARQQREAKRRSVEYREGRPAASVEGKTAIIVDYGIATGHTMRLAVRSAKARHLRKIVVAVPVAPPGSAALLKAEGADEVIMLEPPETFSGAVGAHYALFEQVADEDVLKLLRASL